MENNVEIIGSKLSSALRTTPDEDEFYTDVAAAIWEGKG